MSPGQCKWRKHEESRDSRGSHGAPLTGGEIVRLVADMETTPREVTEGFRQMLLP